jgi:hypothetical protein
MSKSISAETARIKLELIKGATYTLPFTLTGYGDITAFTWLSVLRAANDNTSIATPTVTALTATSGTATITATQAANLTVKSPYEWLIYFTGGTTQKVVITAEISVIEGV